MNGIIESAADWRGPDIIKRNDWIHHVSAQEADEVRRSLARAKADGISFDTITRENFALPGLSRVLARALDMLEEGPGLFHLRGFPSTG